MESAWMEEEGVDVGKTDELEEEGGERRRRWVH